MEYAFAKVSGHDEPPSYDVVLDGAIIGRVERRWLLRRGFSKSKMSAGHRHMWSLSVADVEGLDDDARRSLRREMKRDKTSRDSAARYLIEAYERAGVPVPGAPSETADAA